MKELMVWELQMYTIDDKTGKETVYTYNGDCSFICDYVTIDECTKLVTFDPLKEKEKK